MAWIQQDTYRAMLWHNLNVLTEKALLYAQMHEGVTTTSTQTWLKETLDPLDPKGKTTLDTQRQTLHAAKKAASDPFHGRRVTDNGFAEYVDRVLRGRLRTEEDIEQLRQLEHFFENKYWPLEQAWGQFRAKRQNKTYVETMEDLLTGETLNSLSNDMERLIAWSKEKIHSAYMSNRYADASNAAKAIVWQLFHVISRSPVDKRNWLFLAYLRISFYSRLVVSNVEGEAGGWEPLGRLELARNNSEIAVILREIKRNSFVSDPWHAFQSVETGDFTDPLSRLMGAHEFLFLHAASDYARMCLAGKAAGEPEMFLTEPNAPTEEHEVAVKKTMTIIHTLKRVARASKSIKDIPEWLLDQDIYPSMSVASLRAGSYSIKQSDPNSRTSRLTAARVEQAHWIFHGLFKATFGEDGLDVNGALSYEFEKWRYLNALTGKEKCSMNGDVILNSAAILSECYSLSGSMHLATWAEFYLICSEYFEERQLQHGAMMARKWALAAVNCLDSEKRKQEMEKEICRLRTAPMNFAGDLSDSDRMLLLLVEGTPIFLMDERIERVLQERRQRFRSG